MKWTADADTNAFQMDGIIFVRGSFTPGFIPAYITDRGGQTVYGDLTVTGTITGLTPTGGGWTDGGTNVYLTTGTDNVGIGTTVPAQKLHVEGQCVTGDTMLSVIATKQSLTRSIFRPGLGETRSENNSENEIASPLTLSCQGLAIRLCHNR